MKNQILTLMILTSALGRAFGQSDSTTVYRGLDTVKFYSVSLRSQSAYGIVTYQVNGKDVSKSTYDKYKSTWKAMGACRPCYLKTYDEQDVLLRESVSCTDCGVGVFKEYYGNGRVKLSGRYKENASGNWDRISDRGLCSVPDGQWTYFDEQGDTLYAEFWADGEFIQQVPEQQATEIWKVELTLNGETIDKQPLSTEQVKALVVTPKYKNSHTEGVNLTVNFEVTAIGHRKGKQTFTLDSFKHIDVLNMLSDLGIPAGKQTSFMMEICNNGKVIARFYLNVVH